MEAVASRSILAATGERFIVSDCDFCRVVQYKWHMWRYLHCGELQMDLHQFIMGPRPANIPENYVIDHADRDRLNATQENLRWVSESFNSWNRAKKTNTTSKFIGVSFNKERGKWKATCAGKQLGRFSNERDAAKAVAKEAIVRWDDWAAKSDLLIGPELLTVEEIMTIQQELTLRVAKEARTLPKGVRVSKTMRYTARYAGKHLGNFDTAEEAGSAYSTYVEDLREQKWRQHVLTPIFKDQDGDAAILLTGKYSDGHSAKCPEHLWHQLTFETTWWYDGIYALGQWEKSKHHMHRVVFQLCNPEWDRKLQVDHMIPEKTLDNRECNLRIATQSLQAYNKSKRSGTKSDYIGVSPTKSGKWLAKMTKDGKTYSVGCKFTTQHDAARALNAKAIELWGKDARLVKILDEVDDDDDEHDLAESSTWLQNLEIN